MTRPQILPLAFSVLIFSPRPGRAALGLCGMNQHTAAAELTPATARLPTADTPPPCWLQGEF